MQLSASSAASDLALSQWPGPEGQNNGWPSSAALDLALSQWPGPEGQNNGWPSSAQLDLALSQWPGPESQNNDWPQTTVPFDAYPAQEHHPRHVRRRAQVSRFQEEEGTWHPWTI